MRASSTRRGGDARDRPALDFRPGRWAKPCLQTPRRTGSTTPSTFREAVALLDRRQETRIRLGLRRIQNHLLRLGDPQEAFASIHVAGTNGKGSVCAMLDSVLREAGYRVGLYTSPHLEHVRERIKVDGKDIPEADFARLMGRTLSNDPRGELTYFELLTSVAFQYFQEQGVSLAVLETGLGGRLDATNVVRRPTATVITTIDFDHMGFLGDTLASIAGEKAGILKRGCPAFCAETKAQVLSVIRARARDVGAPLKVLPRTASWRGRLGLIGAAQPRNAALALEALQSLRREGWSVPEAAVRRGLAAASWPCRFEVLKRGGRTVILDGAHNEEAMRHFVETFSRSSLSRRRPAFLLGFLRDKQYRAMVRVLGPWLEKAVLTAPPSPRALHPEVLARELDRVAPRAQVSVQPDPERALRGLLASPERTVCVLGSFYLAGMARRVLGEA